MLPGDSEIPEGCANDVLVELFQNKTRPVSEYEKCLKKIECC